MILPIKRLPDHYDEAYPTEYFTPTMVVKYYDNGKYTGQRHVSKADPMYYFKLLRLLNP